MNATPGDSNGFDADHNFQVDLRGVIDLLSKHLYSGPAVFMREMLQNCVDAIEMRRTIGWNEPGEIRIELIEPEDSPPTILFSDNGVGLTSTEARDFLATIGQSSKRGDLLDRNSKFGERKGGFLGQFGIGLLSGFLVSDEIVVVTRSAKEPTMPPVEWRGKSDGTYAIRELEGDIRIGTQVYLKANNEGHEYFTTEQVEALATHYGEYLEPEILIQHNESTHPLNRKPPWEHNTWDKADHARLMEYGRDIFDREFLDVIPLPSIADRFEGVAFVLARSSHAGAKQPHRLYLKKMLLSENHEGVLPDWAFFVQCVINAKTPRPTASRESFREDEELETVRQELGEVLREYLMDMAKKEPERLRRFIDIHHLPLKSLALEDDACLETFADLFPFESTVGEMPLGVFLAEHDPVYYVPTLDQFRQIAQVAASQSIPILNAGYVYDVQLLERLDTVRSDINVEPFDPERLASHLEPLTPKEEAATSDFLELAETTLDEYQCLVELGVFQPKELPALYVSNSKADFLRSLEKTQEVTDELWGGILDTFAKQVSSVAYSRLHLNYSNRLIRRLTEIDNLEIQSRCIGMLYVQSLLLGHFPLKGNEIQLLNEGLLGLIDCVLDGSPADADTETNDANEKREGDML
jgi:molecular chaperone HtpG